jgi:nitrile hydratase
MAGARTVSESNPSTHDGKPRFAISAPVRVDAAVRAGHIRTPLYLLGKRGRIFALQGAYQHAERLAYQDFGPRVPLYLVEFDAAEVWGAKVAQAEHGHPLLVEIYEDWLTPDRPSA